ncbi:methyltransferase domain-containing protein [Streptomyces violaceusniger]|uniref:Methyltransferase type 11 n=1 Tax=Streptomyces violaceusniger (strain Tu 4113) TaxID=653045 RepID=G2P5M0_STRV4|nr:methyltransferase domain-containing protein [Streptomyces violaceusniger]AEM85051.1 Methyltransferase type 11 [Streptomyces violaceusniger Tu 4113]
MSKEKHDERETREHATDGLIARLDRAERSPGAERLRTRTYELLAAEPGAPVVDVGCGAGRAVAELAERGARVTGVDADVRMVAVARERWPGADFRVADVGRLPFGDGTVHGYRADKALHELPDPAAALAEARRVLAPGGRVVLVGQDWEALVLDAADAALTRTIVHARASLIPSPRAARRQRGLLLDAGLSAVTAEAHTTVLTGPEALPLLTGLAERACAAGAITGDQAGAWCAEQRERARTDRLFLAVPMFLAAGTAG